MTNKQIAMDLLKHVDDRVDRAFDDFLDCCEVMDVESEDANLLLVTLLGARFVAAALAANATEPEFIGLCIWHYRKGCQALQRSRQA